jgi:hypothetical protein
MNTVKGCCTEEEGPYDEGRNFVDPARFDRVFSPLGGLRPLGTGTTFHPLPEEEIKGIEAYLHAPLPSDYRSFLSEIGGAVIDGLVSFRPLTQLPTCEPDGNEPFSYFYGAECEGFDGLLASIKLYRDQKRIPLDLIPIGANMFGDQMCLAIGGKDRERVFFWDHEDERSELDYWELHGPNASVPREFLYGNVYLVATSFDDFLARLVRDQQE